MSALWGTIVNTIAIVVASLLGLVVPKMQESMHRTVVQGLGIFTSVLGVSMAIKSDRILFMAISLVLGAVLGEALRLEDRLEAVGRRLERRVGKDGRGEVGKAFVTASLIFCIGAMAILGPIDGAVRHNYDLLYTKSLMDGFLAIILTSTLGIGVIFSAIAVLLYQGMIGLAAGGITSLFTASAVDIVSGEMAAIGGVLIIGVGINLLGFMKVKVANMLPAVLIMAVLTSIAIS
ncbi:DUF554 domain-containing protein [Gorillibacterium massiliense]|uniref:DUF554 domain-containing protein n=1 Tax=Gorillibacterium massiliense TaxID=1280390 RepID=UPI0004AC60AE|nr:DUF554 domain-containing protein [Gorillibacterium massiliense]